MAARAVSPGERLLVVCASHSASAQLLAEENPGKCWAHLGLATGKQRHATWAHQQGKGSQVMTPTGLQGSAQAQARLGRSPGVSWDSSPRRHLL